MSTKVMILCVAVFGQIGVLVGEYLNSVYPLWWGEEIRLEVVPVDPRSLFRGNYARLNYPIDQVDGSQVIQAVGQVRNGERVYVPLHPSEGVYIAGRATLQKPESGLFIRGRVRASQGSRFEMDYGIDAFFAPKVKALALEKSLRTGGVATVRIASNGKAALVDVSGKE